MNSYKLSMAGIKVSEGISRFGGVSSLYEKYLIKFPEDDNYINLREALNNNDVKSAFSYAHALKGLTGNLSLKSLYDSVYVLVEELRNDNLESSKEQIKKVELEYEKTVSAILSQI